ncbi:MAG: hypothetical protein EBR73_10305 [Rhodobacteraceae bacterium]|nr:hypothetical protein [Paracoccaceae bacterium]
MELEQAMQGRRSIRGFLDKPVPKDLLEEIIALANRAPSSMNTQPWHLHVLTGAPLEAVRQGNTERMLAGIPPSREIEDYAAYDGAHRARQIEIAVQLFQAMGIERHDAERRQDWVMRGFRQFDAPVLGWPDDTFEANAVVSRRRPVENVTRFLGFDGA